MSLTDREVAILDPLGRSLPASEQLLGRLVALNSFTSHREGVNAVGELLAGELSSLGFRISELVAGRGGRTLVARRNGDPSHRLLLLGHLDTVHPPSSSFTSYLRGAEGTDLATGPGAADMKGGLVVMLAALRALAAAGELDARQVTVVLTADEEIGSPSSAEIVRAEGGDADLCLCFEPGRRHDDGTTTFVTARRGYGRLTVHVRGRAAHAGVDPRAGASAILELAHKIVALHGLAAPDDGVLVNVGTVRGGTATNTVPEEAFADVEFRFPDADAEIELEERITHLLGRSVLRDEKDDRPLTVTRLLDPAKRPALERSEAMGRMAARVVAWGADLGLRLAEETRGGSSDAALAADAGCPAICGLGVVGGGFHTDEEWIVPSSLVDRARLAALTMLRFFAL